MRFTFDWYNCSLYFVVYYLLLEDCLQKKTFANLRNPVYRGELLHASEPEGWYVHDSNPRLSVNCSRDQVKHVHYVYPKFLLAITDLNSRYDLFINKLELLSSIALHTIGDEVEVRLENEDIPVTAIIRYIGPLRLKVGTYFGVEILVRQLACTS